MTGIERIAKASGCDVQTIRMLLRSDKCVFGTALKKEGGKNFIYILYPEKVKELFGVEVVERTEHDTRNHGNSIGS